MITQEQYLESIQHEINVCKHLYTKITDAMLNYRPTPGQRSTLELLQYLSGCGIVPIRGILSGDWPGVHAAIEKTKELRVQDFCAAMDRQMQEIREVIRGIPEADFAAREVVMPTGQKSRLGPALLNYPFKFLAAYRMQLFLYIKANGRAELSTYNCWMGIDKPTDQPSPH